MKDMVVEALYTLVCLILKPPYTAGIIISPLWWGNKSKRSVNKPEFKPKFP